MKFIIIFFLGALNVFAQSYKVVKVKDGDTIVILDSLYQQHTIRLANIDCPERGQPFSAVAKDFVAAQVFQKNITIDSIDTDRYGRTIAYVLYDTKNLSKELLKQGLAWHYKYYSQDQELSDLESVAQQNKLGLWSEPNPINPYLWRKGKRQ